MKGRSTLTTLVGSILAVSLVAVVFANARITTTIDEQLSANWRGQYDILVLPQNSGIEASETSGLIDPNFVASAGSSGIALSQLEAIRALNGVEIAAPVGMVGVLSNDALGVSVSMEHTHQQPLDVLMPGPVMLRLGLVAEAYDERSSEAPLIVADHQGFVAISQLQGAGAGSEPVYAWGSSNPYSASSGTSGVTLSFDSLPFFAHTVYAIDPEAESRLIGENGAPYAKALSSIPEARDTQSFTHQGDSTTASLWTSWFSYIDEERFGFFARQLEFAHASGETGAVLPLVVKENTTRRLNVQLNFAAGDIGVEELPEHPDYSLIDGVTYEDIGVIELDMSELLVPFSVPESIIPWLGQTNENTGSGYGTYSSENSLVPALIGRPQYIELEPRGGTPSYELVPLGLRHADGKEAFEWPAGDYDKRSHGQVQAYRNLDLLQRPQVRNIYLAPVGTFMINDLLSSDADNPSYVPTGITPSDTAMKADGSLIAANDSQVDFLTATAGAFTDLEGGLLLRGETPIDVVRVRVADVADYSPANQQKILEVARQIMALGLEARVVAGSSLTEVALFVPDYYVSAEGSADDLGWVTQEWTSLGAAVQVEGVSIQLLAVISWSAFLLILAGFLLVLLLAFQAQRKPLTVLNNVGWKESERRGYLVRSAAPAIALVTAAAVLTLVIPPGGVSLFPLVALSAVLIGTLGGAWYFVKERPRSGASRTRTVQTISGLAVRQVSALKGTVAMGLLGTSSIGIIIYMVVRFYEQLRESAGQTRLAEYMFTINGIAFIVLGASGVVISIVLIFISRLTELKNRRQQVQVLAYIGFGRSELRQQFLLEDLIIAGITLAVTATVLALAVTLLGFSVPGIILSVCIMLAAVLARGVAGWFVSEGRSERANINANPR